ncbi:hypothetical protein BDZ94DRAFT_1247626 [Collybia nuda]|uniref:Uncharacterized protein n=1 Tax=Collybia nuda TaxID=64659 RepID=A0A9P5YCY5_9AGAR|nr:hypothetical protein BDZ94DRAFT_1247626 [Collybia nuda]
MTGLDIKDLVQCRAIMGTVLDILSISQHPIQDNNRTSRLINSGPILCCLQTPFSYHLLKHLTSP